MPAEVLGRRLAAARALRGLTLEEAAEQSRIPLEHLSEAESGVSSLSASVLLALARVYGVDVSDLILGHAANSTRAKFRASHAVEQPDDVSLVEKLARKYDAIRDLQKIVAGAQPHWQPLGHQLPNPKDWAEARSQGIAVAQQVRKQLQLHGPIEDLHALLRMRGIAVFEATLPQNVSGVFLNPHSAPPAIIIEPEDMDERQRFSLAHEFGHIAIDSDVPALVSRPSSDRLIEIRANAFAGELLMPQSDLAEYEKRVGKYLRSLDFIDVSRLAAHFFVSYSGAAYHLRLANIFDRAKYDLLLSKKTNANAYRAQSLPAPPATAVRKSLDGVGFALARKAFEESQISTRKLREYARLFGVADDEIESFLSEADSES